METADRSVRPGFERIEHGTAPAFDKTQAETIGRRFRDGSVDFAVRESVDERAAQTERFQSSAKRTVTRAATSPSVCGILRGAITSYGGSGKSQRRSNACPLARPQRP